MKVAEIVTNKIIEQLEKGFIPWIKPWGSADAINFVSRKPYKGINILLLNRAGEYLTFKQCQAAGGRVKKGAKAEIIVFWTMFKGKDLDPKTKEPKIIPMLRYYSVFHLSDCEDLESKIKPGDAVKLQRIEDKDQFAADYMDREHIKYNQVHGNKAYYQPATDSITLPLTEQFESIEEYYSVLFHEMVHSTGTKGRLDRLEAELYHSGKDSRSKEELVAEIGAASLMNDAGLETMKTFKNSAAYIQSWLEVFRQDHNIIIQASSKSQKAIDFIYAV